MINKMLLVIVKLFEFKIRLKCHDLLLMITKYNIMLKNCIYKFI
jgi:hypothetical protein